MESYENKTGKVFKHGEKCGEHLTFSKGEKTETFVLPNSDKKSITYSSASISGNSVYCAKCNHFSTVKGKDLFYGILWGECKKCGANLIENN